jgi:hypothetical protein
MATDREFVRSVFPEAFASGWDYKCTGRIWIYARYFTEPLGSGRTNKTAWQAAAHTLHDNDERTGR